MEPRGLEYGFESDRLGSSSSNVALCLHDLWAKVSKSLGISFHICEIGVIIFPNACGGWGQRD